MKRCRFCEVEKPTTDFYRHSKNSDGLQSYCRPCMRSRASSARSKICVGCRIRQNRDEFVAVGVRGKFRLLLCSTCVANGVLHPRSPEVLRDVEKNRQRQKRESAAHRYCHGCKTWHPAAAVTRKRCVKCQIHEDGKVEAAKLELAAKVAPEPREHYDPDAHTLAELRIRQARADERNAAAYDLLAAQTMEALHGQLEANPPRALPVHLRGRLNGGS